LFRNENFDELSNALNGFKKPQMLKKTTGKEESPLRSATNAASVQYAGVAGILQKRG